MTRRHRVGAIFVATLLAAVLGFVGFRYYPATPAQNSGYSTDLNDLRAQFNRDKGKVRLLMLLSPT